MGGTQIQPPLSDPSARAFRVAAWGAALLTFVLIVVGGLVTSLEVGLSVPDWPTTEGASMLGAAQADLTPGQRVEHGHRLLGMTVGAVTLLMACCGLWGAWRGALSTSTGLFAGLALCAVVVQGIFGGLRVNAISTTWAMIHAGLAQAIFCLLVGLATVSLGRWTLLGGRKDEQPPMWLGAATALVVYAQVLLGILTRHLGPLGGGNVAEVHIGGALVSACGVGWLASRAASVPKMRALALALLVVLVLQLGLGFTAWGLAYTTDSAAGTSAMAVAIATSHVAIGAVLLALTVTTALVAGKLARPRAIQYLADFTPVPFVPGDAPAGLLA